SGNRPSTTEIDCRRLILVLPPGSGQSAYRSAAGPVCAKRYGSYRLWPSVEEIEKQSSKP
ncbi:hypothetical protein GW17_00042091, partial [Ensete ventricosum]